MGGQENCPNPHNGTWHLFSPLGRIKDSYWYDYGSSADVDRVKYGYDRNDNRVWRENTVAAANAKDLDELYSYDLIDRLKTTDRGDLNANKDAITNEEFAQDWSLDATGNWRNFREDDDGAGWDLDQQRTANKVNEITDISEMLGPSWLTPAYDRAGNMTTIPKPADLTVAFTATYDAWNRLVKIEVSGNTLAKYQYDGAKRRTIKDTYSGGMLDKTRHFYYTEPSKWQVIEERVNGGAATERQFVWGLRYVDDVVARDRDTTGDGTLDERLYGMQDANWNVTTVASSAGAVVERTSYTAYGAATALDAAFEYRGTSLIDWDVAFAGYRYDSDSLMLIIRNRFYHSMLGIFTQRDHLLNLRCRNLYEYAASHPLSITDPTGEWIIPALCLTACAGCLGVAAIGIGTCAANSNNADDFWACIDAFVDALPWWHKLLWTGVCIGCAGCVVRWSWPVVVPIVKRCARLTGPWCLCACGFKWTFWFPKAWCFAINCLCLVG